MTVNIPFQKNRLSENDDMAPKNPRSSSEMLREAARAQAGRKKQWEKIFQLGDTVAKKKKLKNDDVVIEIQSYRKRKIGHR